MIPRRTSSSIRLFVKCKFLQEALPPAVLFVPSMLGGGLAICISLRFSAYKRNPRFAMFWSCLRCPVGWVVDLESCIIFFVWKRFLGVSAAAGCSGTETNFPPVEEVGSRKQRTRRHIYLQKTYTFTIASASCTEVHFDSVCSRSHESEGCRDLLPSGLRSNKQHCNFTDCIPGLSTLIQRLRNSVSFQFLHLLNWVLWCSFWQT